MLLTVNPEFDEFWDNHSDFVNFELSIPEVVRGELLFQQTTSAIKALDKANENILAVSEITNNDLKISTTKEKIKHQVEKKFDKWLKGKKGVICTTPIETIDWKNICESAVWRKHVFSPDKKNPDAEKGFRDRLIYESVLNFVQNEKRKGVKISFICNDFLLRTNAKKKLVNDRRFSCYENLPEFSSYLKLNHEQLTDKFIKSILSKAQHKFFAIGDYESLYYKENISNLIHEKYGNYIKFPERSKNPLFDISGNLNTSESWIQSASSSLFISNPEFQNLTGERQYHWESKISQAIVYKRELNLYTGLLVPTSPSTIDEMTLFLEFKIAWRADVRKNSTFYNVELEDVIMSKNEFRFSTPKEKEYYGLPT